MTGISGAHLEVVLENEIAEHLAAHGWDCSPTDAGYDRDLALFPDDVLGWLAETQRPEFEKVVRPGDTEAQREAASRSILTRLAKSSISTRTTSSKRVRSPPRPDIAPARAKRRDCTRRVDSFTLVNERLRMCACFKGSRSPATRGMTS